MKNISGSEPIVTVCIPTYCGGDPLRAAIESVLAQTYTNFELVVIDDCSPDQTMEVVKRFSDSRIRYLKNETNLGPQGNWNRCLEVARGTYVKLLPHDDVLDASCLQAQVSALESDAIKSLALVFCARHIIGPNGTVLATRGPRGFREGPVAAKEIMRSCVRNGTNIIGEPGAVLFRKSLADTVGKFDGINPYVIDLDYWVRLLAYGDGYYLKKPLAGFRVSKASWSVAIGRGQSRDFGDFVARVCAKRLNFLTGFDFFLGRLMAIFNNLARLLFYRLYIR